MRRFALAVCHLRPSGILVAIFGLCLFSMLLSVYYVHSMNMSPPLDIIAAREGEWMNQHIKVTNKADDSREEFSKKGMVMSSLRNKYGRLSEYDAESLNNIDITLHIEEKEKDSPPHANKFQNRNVAAPEPAHIADRVVPPKKIQEDEMWPVRHKVQKKIHKHYLSSNPLYEKPVRTRKNWNGEKYIVYLCYGNLTCAGWGDRQHGIFSAYMISFVTNRTFKVDFSNPCTLTKLYHSRINNWKIEPGEFDGLSSTHIYALNDRSFRELMKEIDFDEHYPQDVVYLTTNYDFYYSFKGNLKYRDKFNKKVRGRPRPILFADLWQGIFKMNRRVIRKFTPALNQVGDHKLVCAHIRFGRNPTIPHDSDIRNTLDTIKPFWDFVEKYSDPSKYRLFVASDYEGLRKKVNKLYKDIAIDVEGNVIHIDQLARQGNKTIEDSDFSCDGLEKVIADQHVLSKCDILLLTYSVFGKSAAYLRRSNKDLYLMDKGKIRSLVLFNEPRKTRL